MNRKQKMELMTRFFKQKFTSESGGLEVFDAPFDSSFLGNPEFKEIQDRFLFARGIETWSFFSPFKQLLQARAINYDSESLDNLLTRCEIYEPHRNLFIDLLTKRTIYQRTEEIMFVEVDYEQKRIKNTLGKLILEEFKDNIIIIESANNLPLSTYELLLFLHEEDYFESLKILLFCNNDYKKENTILNKRFDHFIDKINGDHPLFSLNLNDDVDKKEDSPVLLEPMSLYQSSIEAFQFLAFKDVKKDLALIYQNKELMRTFKVFQKNNLLFLILCSCFYTKDYSCAISWAQLCLKNNEVDIDENYLTKINRFLALIYFEKKNFVYAQNNLNKSLKLMQKNSIEAFFVRYNHYYILYSQSFFNLPDCFSKNEYRLLIEEARQRKLDNYLASLLGAPFCLDPEDDSEEINKNFQEALALTHLSGNKVKESTIWHFMGLIKSRMHEKQNVIDECYAKSLKIRKFIGDKIRLSYIYNGLGFRELCKGNFQNAHDHFFYSLSILRDELDFVEITSTLYNLGFLNLMKRNYFLSIKYFELLIKISVISKIKQIRFHSWNEIYSILILCYLKINKPAKAFESYLIINERNLEPQPSVPQEIALYNFTKQWIDSSWDQKEIDLKINPFEKTDKLVDKFSTVFLLFYYYEKFNYFNKFNITNRTELALSSLKETAKKYKNQLYLNLADNLVIKADSSGLEEFKELDWIISTVEKDTQMKNLSQKIEEIELINNYQQIINHSQKDEDLIENTVEIINHNFIVDFIFILRMKTNYCEFLSSRISKKGRKTVDLAGICQFLDSRIKSLNISEIKKIDPTSPFSYLYFIPLGSEEKFYLICGNFLETKRELSETEKKVLSIMGHILASAREKIAWESEIKTKNQVLAERVEKRTSDLMNMRQHLNGVVNSIDEIIISIDDKNCITMCNNLALMLAAHSNTEKLYGLLIEEGFTFLLPFKEKISSINQSRKAEVLYDQKITCNDNHLYNIFISPLDGVPQPGLIIRLEDVTEIHKKDSQLFQAQKMEIVGHLVSGIAHDFNNVISGILGAVSMMRLEQEEAENISNTKLSDYLDMLEESGYHAKSIVGQLLSLSSNNPLTMKIYNLNDSIQRVIRLCESFFEHSVHIFPSLYPGKALFNGDCNLIEQVLLNLSVNAAHSMTIMRKPNEKQGGILGIMLAEEDEFWKLSVSDNGIGMDSELQNKIFTPFFSTKPKGKGSGLGLSMVQNIIHQHKGYIELTSTLGEGSRFDLFLPKYFDF